MAEKAKEKETKSMAPWRPFGDLTRWEKDMETLMEDFFGRTMRPWRSDRWSREAGMDVRAPAVDLYEEKDDVVVKAELPGIEKDSIEVNLTDHTLTIKGEKKKEQEIKDENYYRSERSYGSFVRMLELPRDVQGDKVNATFKNGILEVRILKSEEARTREIKVKVD